MIRALAVALAALGAPALAQTAQPSQTGASASACDQPVYMVVSGVTHDRARMAAYTRALLASDLYARLGGYYVNTPRAVATFEGQPLQNHALLIVRFPCLRNAEAFWNSRTYQQVIKPMRLNPSAGDYRVTVYPEAPLAPHMSGKVEGGRYLQPFDAAGVQPDAPRPK